MKSLSIRMKFLLVTSSLLAFCIAVYLLVAATAIRKDKTNLVFDYNRSLVENLATEIDLLLKSSADKMQLLAYIQGSRPENLDSLLNQLVGENSEIFWISKSDNFEVVSQHLYQDDGYLEVYELNQNIIGETLASSVPFEKIQQKGEAVWSVKVDNGPPLLGFGKNVVFEDQAGRKFQQFALLTFLKTDRLLKSMESVRNHDLFVMTEEGQVLLDSNSGRLQIGAVSQIFSQIKDQPLRTNVMEIELEGQKLLSGSSKAFQKKISVVSLVSESQAFAVVDKLVRRSLHIAAILGFLAFFAAYGFSKSLTKPLETLVNGMKSVAMGKLDTRIHIHSGDEISVLATSFNHMISDLEQSRSQLEDINRDLEGKVKERTRQLEKQNQAVKSAQEALLRTTRLAAVGEIAGRAAHEVLNPLTSILSRVQKVKNRLEKRENGELRLLGDISGAWTEDFEKGGFEELVENWKRPSEVMKEQTLWDEDISNLKLVQQSLSREWADLIQDTQFLISESERINRIVQSMRGLSIVKSEKAVHDINSLVEEAVNVMADYASKDDVVISLKPSGGRVSVSADKDEFLQSLTNLIRNSVQAIVARRSSLSEGTDFQGEIELEIKERAEAVVVKISDNGCGITEENQARLFDSHFTTKTRQEGTGLGLNISRRFIRAVGGDIELLHSAPGVGSSFLVNLPKVANNKQGKVSA
ncbi:MAG: HAMP domain-containing protein [Bdellovibrionales bacterium]|nr:HAMP domain-containing protein [Bdellovibrionales bacterium]